MQFKEFLESIGACEPALEWVGDRDAETAWAECDQADWLMWLAYDAGESTHKPLVRIALECARLTPITHPLLLDSLNDVERWLVGESVDFYEITEKFYRLHSEEIRREAAKVLYTLRAADDRHSGGDLDAVDLALVRGVTQATLCEIARRHLPWSVIGPLIHAKMGVA